jgi:large subunit ribosomal protein L21
LLEKRACSKREDLIQKNLRKKFFFAQGQISMARPIFPGLQDRETLEFDLTQSYHGVLILFCLAGGQNMYAIVQTGGKQYRVQPGDHLKVEKLPGDPGTEISLDQVLAITTGEGITVGRPFVEHSSVRATIVRTAKDRKIVVFKKKRRKGYHKKQGHRQWFTLLRIDALQSQAAAEPVAVPVTETSETV